MTSLPNFHFEPIRIRKAIKALAGEATPSALPITFNDEVMAAFEFHETAPEFYMLIARRSHVEQVLLRNISKLADINDERAARWISRIFIGANFPLIFNVLLQTDHTEEGRGKITRDTFVPLALHSIRAFLGAEGCPYPRLKGFSDSLTKEKVAQGFLSWMIKECTDLDDILSACPVDRASPALCNYGIAYLGDPSEELIYDYLFGNSVSSFEHFFGKMPLTFLNQCNAWQFAKIISRSLISARDGEARFINSDGDLIGELDHVIESRLGLPWENPSGWEKVDHDAKDFYQTLKAGKQVQQFFSEDTDPRRREFWMQYVGSFVSFPRMLGKGDRIFAMVFPTIIVIEAKEHGCGAVYIHERVKAEKMFFKPNVRFTAPGYFKKHAPERPKYSQVHRGDWERKLEGWLYENFGLDKGRRHN